MAVAQVFAQRRALVSGPLVGPVWIAGIASIGTVYVGLVDPNQPGHYLTCPLKALTGLDCPFCGGLRATHALTRGDVVAAADHNLLFVVLLPLLVWLFFRWARRSWSSYRSPGIPGEVNVWQRAGDVTLFRSCVLPWVVPAVALGWAVLRNLPAFSWLAST